MKDWTIIHDRYVRDALPVRLGGLAANLRRIQTFTQHAANQQAVEGLLEESKHFIEWTAREATIEAAAELVELQIQLARWQRHWPNIWASSEQRQQVSAESQVWATRVLDLSGLLG